LELGMLVKVNGVNKIMNNQTKALDYIIGLLLLFILLFGLIAIVAII
jgi:hypothetical protein